MKTLELFSGTKSFSKIAKELGHEVFTIDNDPNLFPDIICDIENLRTELLPYIPDIIWASPPCTHFSVASIGKNWNRDGTPRNDGAILAQEIVLSTIELIEALKPKYWFIENPRGMLRKMPFMKDFKRYTISYCQYGDTRQKPTDIWTNADFWKPRPICKPGAICHIAAPRGSRTGTQGLKNAKDRGVIPPELFKEIFFQLNDRNKN